MKVYIVVGDEMDRPYTTTSKPSRERRASLEAQGCEVFEVDVKLPGWEWDGSQVNAVARPMDLG